MLIDASSYNSSVEQSLQATLLSITGDMQRKLPLELRNKTYEYYWVRFKLALLCDQLHRKVPDYELPRVVDSSDYSLVQARLVGSTTAREAVI